MGIDRGAADSEWLKEMTAAITVLTRSLRQPRQSARIGERSGLRLEPHLYLIFTRIGEYQPVRSSDLARYMEVDRSTISRSVNELVAAGYVVRSPDPRDARTNILRLSPAGERALERLWQAWHEELGAATQSWRAGERAIFVELLSRLASAIELQVWDGSPPWVDRPAPRTEATADSR